MATSAGASSWSGSSGGSNSSQGRSIATAQPAQEERLVVSIYSMENILFQKQLLKFRI